MRLEQWALYRALEEFLQMKLIRYMIVEENVLELEWDTYLLGDT